MYSSRLLVSLFVLNIALPALADDLPPVTPYRPSVASPAQLPALGQLELEMGGLSEKKGSERRNSLPYQLKLAFSDQWGVVLGGEAYISDRQNGRHTNGFGDTSVTLKRAFAIDDKTGLGLELTAMAPTAKDALGSGKADYTLNGIFSKDFGALHMDLNLNETRPGAIDPGSGRMQTGWAASFSTPLDERWTATGELSGTRQAHEPNTAQLLAALTFNPTPRLAIDVGIAKGLTHASQDWSLFSGVVLPLANLW
jgi:hypothetical protein